MMKSLSATTLFCEDIREEVGGAHTIVGVMPESIIVPQLPGNFPRLVIYTRIILDSETDPGAIRLYLKFPDNFEQEIGNMSAQNVSRALADARKNKSLGVSLIFKVVTAAMLIGQEGKLIAIARSELGEQICGSLNIVVPQP